MMESKNILAIGIVALCFAITYSIYNGNDQITASLISTLGLLVALYKKLEKDKEEHIIATLLGEEGYREYKSDEITESMEVVS